VAGSSQNNPQQNPAENNYIQQQVQKNPYLTNYEEQALRQRFQKQQQPLSQTNSTNTLLEQLAQHFINK
jgi:hypothetical protein